MNPPESTSASLMDPDLFLAVDDLELVARRRGRWDVAGDAPQCFSRF